MAYRGQRGSGFVGLNEYLSRNQEAAQKMGAGLAEGVDAEGMKAERAIADAQQEFDSRAAAGLPSAEATPGAYARKESFTYSGPKELRDVADVDALDKQAQAAQEKAAALNSEAGRATLLRQQAAPNGGYSPGQAGLDAFLAGRGAAPTLQATSSRYGELRKRLGLAEEGAKSTATARAGEAGGLYDTYMANMRAAKTPARAPAAPSAPAVTPRQTPQVSYDAHDKPRPRRKGYEYTD